MTDREALLRIRDIIDNGDWWDDIGMAVEAILDVALGTAESAPVAQSKETAARE